MSCGMAYSGLKLSRQEAMGISGRLCITHSRLWGRGKVTNAASRDRYSGNMEAIETTRTKFLGGG